MTLIKYLFPIILALMPIQAYAQCIPPEAVVSVFPSAQVYQGKDLRNYIDAFNTVTGGDQGYDDFDTMLVVPLGEGKTGLAFFKEDCLIGDDAVPDSLERDIQAVLGRRVGP